MLKYEIFFASIKKCCIFVGEKVRELNGTTNVVHILTH